MKWVASNSSGIEDPDYNQTVDWIELYNASNETINLADYYQWYALRKMLGLVAELSPLAILFYPIRQNLLF